jgi:hypothetical protein
VKQINRNVGPDLSQIPIDQGVALHTQDVVVSRVQRQWRPGHDMLVLRHENTAQDAQHVDRVQVRRPRGSYRCAVHAR